MSVITLDKVSKKFSIHHKRARSFQGLVVSMFRDGSEVQEEEFWALRDVSFEVEEGETLGLVGPNGVGKSTVLKLITRILEPTSGSIEVHGRIGALLELGAGFHPDLTGRENIYLSGSVLGLNRQQLQSKVDNIIEFAELERFIDVPVKHYSSGMYVRLGFSVAVHLEPEILLIDEVLAVGDAAFQRKCIDRINQMRRQGVTLMFVSHSPDAVRNICERAIWLDDGRVVADGSAESVVQQYMDRSWNEDEVEVESDVEEEARWGNSKVEIVDVRLLDEGGMQTQLFHVGEPLTVEITYHAKIAIKRPVFGLAIHRADGVHITGPNTRFAGYKIPSIEGRGSVRYTIPSLPLLEGTYFISVAVHNWEDTEMFDYHDRLYPFRVPPSEDQPYGLLSVQGDWCCNDLVR
ncbi:MAG: ABC transporter ATP-binding protein [Anaerolineae bacterium]